MNNITNYGESDEQDDIAVFDKNEAIEIIDDDEDFVKELAGIFINDFPAQISKMKEAINKNDNKTLGKAAHELKGAVSNLGKKAVFKTCLKLEELCEQGSMNEAVKTYDVLVVEIERLAKVLREYIKSK